jgi:hypothetical protein
VEKNPCTRVKLPKKRAQRQKERWFRRAQRWRAGSESTIRTLKHPFSMLRAMYKGERGFQRYATDTVLGEIRGKTYASTLHFRQSYASDATERHVVHKCK